MNHLIELLLKVLGIEEEPPKRRRPIIMDANVSIDGKRVKGEWIIP